MAFNKMLTAGIDPKGISELMAAPLCPRAARSPRWCRYLDEKQNCAVSCTSGDALAAQQGKYWMPCGAIAVKPPTSLKDQRYWSLCRQEELLSSEAECKEAAQQFK